MRNSTTHGTEVMLNEDLMKKVRYSGFSRAVKYIPYCCDKVHHDSAST